MYSILKYATPLSGDSGCAFWNQAAEVSATRLASSSACTFSRNRGSASRRRNRFVETDCRISHGFRVHSQSSGSSWRHRSSVAWFQVQRRSSANAAIGSSAFSAGRLVNMGLPIIFRGPAVASRGRHGGSVRLPPRVRRCRAGTRADRRRAPSPTPPGSAGSRPIRLRSCPRA